MNTVDTAPTVEPVGASEKRALEPAVQAGVRAGMVYPVLSPAELARRWRHYCNTPDASQPDLFELDEYGEIIPMNPPKTPHQRIVWALGKQIETHLGGEVLPGIGVLTRIGVRIPDVVWNPRFDGIDPIDPAPQICVEIQAESNSRRELDEKIGAYLAAGAREVILVEPAGRIRYFGPVGELAGSALGLSLHLPESSYPR